MKYHLICEIVQRGDVVVDKIPFMDNLADFFSKILIGRVFDGHSDSIGVRCVPSML